MVKPIGATPAVGKGTEDVKMPLAPKKAGNQLIGKRFWEELEKHKFVPTTAYSPANPGGHISFANLHPGTSHGTASATNP